MVEVKVMRGKLKQSFEYIRIDGCCWQSRLDDIFACPWPATSFFKCWPTGPFTSRYLLGYQEVDSTFAPNYGIKVIFYFFLLLSLCDDVATEIRPAELPNSYRREAGLVDRAEACISFRDHDPPWTDE